MRLVRDAKCLETKAYLLLAETSCSPPSQLQELLLTISKEKEDDGFKLNWMLDHILARLS